jgi:hypothetical protein
MIQLIRKKPICWTAAQSGFLAASVLWVCFHTLGIIGADRNAADGDPGSSTPAQKSPGVGNTNDILDLLFKTKEEKQAFLDALGSKTNLANILKDKQDRLQKAIPLVTLQTWALEETKNASSRSNNARLWRGVSIEPSQLPVGLKGFGRPVGAAVVRDTSRSPHVRVAWRSIDSFWGIAVGSSNFVMEATDHIATMQVQPGLYVWHGK